MTIDISAQARRIRHAAERQVDAYDPEDEINVVGHGGSLLAFSAAVTALVVAGGLRGQRLPGRYRAADIVLGGVATYKFSRLIAKSSVASPLRAPFTEFEEAAGASEHMERPRDEGRVRHTVGELLTCPFCLAQWVGTAYVAGLAMATPAARAWAAVFAVTAIADAGQHVHARLDAG